MLAGCSARRSTLARKVAATDASVFISGESGTGKRSSRSSSTSTAAARRPLVAINCAALPEPLLESEMFGHRKGAFTGADRDKPGLLEAANGGTLFLDELTEMPMPLQAKLLRVSRTAWCAGSERAAGRRGGRAVHLGHQPRSAGGDRTRGLREDLFYRLRVVPIKLPPLRERLEDIPLLANHFLTVYWQRHRQMGDSACRVSARRAWASCARAPGGATFESCRTSSSTWRCSPSRTRPIQPNDIPVYDDGQEWPAESVVSAAVMDEAYHSAKDRVVAQFEKEYLTRLVTRAGGNMSKAARLASIDRTTLYRLMDKHAFHRDESPGVA